MQLTQSDPDGFTTFTAGEPMAPEPDFWDGTPPGDRLAPPSLHNLVRRTGRPSIWWSPLRPGDDMTAVLITPLIRSTHGTLETVLEGGADKATAIVKAWGDIPHYNPLQEAYTVKPNQNPF